MKKFIIFLVVVAIITFGGYMFVNGYIDKSLNAVDVNDTTQVKIEIPSGSSTNAIAEILYSNNLIQDKSVFKYFAKKEGYDVKLKAGVFALSKSMNVEEILNALINKASFDNTVNLTIIEGLILEDTAKAISDQLSLDYNKLIELMKNADYFRDKYQFLTDNKEIEDLQGYLLPETYNMYKGLNEEEVIDFLLTQFEKYYESTILPAMANSELTFKEMITLASIVEKEAVRKEERSTIAGVFLNRLKVDMMLQSCATVNYARGEWKERLTNEDIAIDSPYNTYINVGLPPTPINSPGKASIDACLNPENTEYLYFLAKGDGSHYFSKTYDEHLAAKEKYLD